MPATPEPWHTELGMLNDVLILDKDERIIVETRPAGDLLSAGKERENARRIVACVNACAGIPTAKLEAGGINDLLQAASTVLAEAYTPEGVYDRSARALAKAIHLLTTEKQH